MLLGRMRALRPLFLAGCVCLAHIAVEPRLLAQRAQTATVDDATRLQIRDLKFQALEARNTKDARKELELQRRILRLDPDDAQALERSSELQTLLEKQAEQENVKAVEALDAAARAERTRKAREVSESALFEYRQACSSETVDRAQRQLNEARKYSRPGDPAIDQLQKDIEAARSACQLKDWELWGLIGLIAVVVVAALVVYYLRRGGRVLEIIQGPQIGQAFALEKETTALGALASEVDWALEDPLRKISRRHCDVVRQGRHYFVVDFSLNGTFLNGQLLQKGQPALLKRGDQIGLGGEVTLLFR